MKVQGAVIKEQGVRFAIVIEKKSIVDSQSQGEEAINSFNPLFPRMPIVLMAQDHEEYQSIEVVRILCIS